ncbi:hypothetical protein WICMUC_005034 [Wickerhamomyces mucosus]|uniref:Uncharacterized protein n=1 Tax=Wickerhamomyces mucosus TaxID=1378264 RepID=A0A9P8PCJ9_9ASCO|nr:hypothetical protein WICMUC_005034 [Wickerhamomyces mucosus]
MDWLFPHCKNAPDAKNFYFVEPEVMDSQSSVGTQVFDWVNSQKNDIAPLIAWGVAVDQVYLLVDCMHFDYVVADIIVVETVETVAAAAVVVVVVVVAVADVLELTEKRRY